MPMDSYLLDNFEDELNFPIFYVAFDEELAWSCNVQQSLSTYAEDTECPGWVRYDSNYNLHINSLHESTIFFC